MRFLHSLDTVRTGLTRAQADRSQRCLLAGIEMRLAALYGEPVVVSEPQAFDSEAFLSEAPQMIDAWSKMPRDAHVLAGKPFVMALRPAAPSFAEAAGRAFLNSDFVLSAWDLTSRQRMLVGEAVRTGKFDGAESAVPHLATKLRALERISSFLESPGACVEAAKSSLALGALIHAAQNQLARTDVGTPERALADDIAAVMATSVDLSRRSEIHSFFRGPGRSATSEDTLLLVDSLYNFVVADSLLSSGPRGPTAHEMFTTDGSLTNPFSAAAGSAAVSVRHTLARPATVTGVMQFIDPSKATTLRGLDWAHVVEIVHSQEWITSVTRLHAASHDGYWDEFERHTVDVLAPALARHHWLVKFAEGVASFGIWGVAAAGGALAVVLLTRHGITDPVATELAKSAARDAIRGALQDLRQRGPSLDSVARGLTARQLMSAAELVTSR